MRITALTRYQRLENVCVCDGIFNTILNLIGMSLLHNFQNAIKTVLSIKNMCAALCVFESAISMYRIFMCHKCFQRKIHLIS